MPREVFVAGQVLTAAELNVVSDQSVMVFADSSARGTAIPSPSEGMVTYLEDTNDVEVYNGSAFTGVGAGKILQVVSTTKTDTFTAATGASTWADITGLSLTVTPSSTSSKILVTMNCLTGEGGADLVMFRLVRDTTPIGVGDAVGSRLQATTANYSGAGASNAWNQASATFLDSPATTSSKTYKVQWTTGTVTGYLNRNARYSDAYYDGTLVSTITAMEVAG